MADDREDRPLKKPGKRGAGHELSAEERALWEHAARALKPLKGKARVHASHAEEAAPAPPSAHDEADVQRAAGAPPRQPARTVTVPPAPPPLSLDRRKARKIGSGKVEIEGRIDLHGMRQAEAHAALRRFLMRAYADGRRWVLVITGKGAPLRRGEDDAGSRRRGSRRARRLETQRAALARGAGAARNRRRVHDSCDPSRRRGRALRAAAARGSLRLTQLHYGQVAAILSSACDRPDSA